MVFSDKKQFPQYLLVGLWLFVQIILFLIYGVQTKLEAEKYTGAASYLSHTGTLPATKYIFYVVLILVIYLFKVAGLDYGGVVIFQIILNGIATYYLYQLALRTTGSQRVAWLTACLFILFFPVQTWNVYLYTESMFISFTIFFTYLILIRPPGNAINFTIGIAALVLLCLTRPAGLLFIIPFLLYSALISKKCFRFVSIGMVLCGFAALYFLVNVGLTGGEDMDALKPFREGHIICFIPDIHPVQLDIIETGNPVRDVFYYIQHNPRHFFTLLYKRIFSFFNLTRPYYSTLHNLTLLAFILPVYVLALLALIRFKRTLRHHIFLFILLLTLLYTLAIAFQCDDYHNRFTMPLFGFILLLASCGYVYLVQEINWRLLN